MFTHEKDILTLEDRKQRLLQEAALQRLIREARAQPEQPLRGWLRLLADLTHTLNL
ncbi:MAG: hypothetical protein SGI73_02990 [Chloroflexota bacterium]|nr:hypothetical protein [Chloroflexota bacterium]